ncbi:BAD_collapsed_G0003130.mRNA.1.CDS.1 [Saccharomyces cerevisiae]|nr:BAD_HP_G0027760.mRNA.1.CDS.1 [Saccharomyces cerevisiae]CAI6596707.1 BAD_HP_G0027760.mRNA.1.CDS.1 [Saccharomyces cerevisiae]CAI7147699.1 BAD_collapsed_G0003130.mRNA.1.CDS.1 [Saccharomyces cerevisiae]
MRFCFDNRKGKERPTEEKKNKINLNKPCSSWIGEKRQKKMEYSTRETSG